MKLARINLVTMKNTLDYSHIIDKVTYRIHRYRLIRARIYLAVNSLCAIGAGFAFFPAIRYFSNSAAGSGFWQYSSLIFSNSSEALSSWKAVLLSVAESIPALEMAAVLGVVLVFANALRIITRYSSHVLNTSNKLGQTNSFFVISK